MSLRERLAAQIRASGPLSIAQYMTACLHDPDFGYYATRPALGAEGDFITAPMVSQMFGEMIGLWAVRCWVELGCPPRLLLVEGGPGDGTLMNDMLRVAGVAPGFREALEVWLVEVSEPLRARQRERFGEAVRWAAHLGEIPAGAPVVFVGNELLDCLPIQQFVRTDRGWAERRVGLDRAGDLVFGLGPAFPLDDELAGGVLETSPAQRALGAQLGGLVAREGGAALLIDYGEAAATGGDTLQALKGHRKVDPLAAPGEADLTAHAQFAPVLAAAEAEGAVAAPLLTQGEFLRRLGIELRAEALACARPDRARAIGRQLDRLIGPDQMGDLFKAACIHSPGWAPPGFQEV